MQTRIFVCTGKFKSLRIFDHICMHICVHICMHICKHTRCISVSYLCHILKGIKYISVKISSFLDRVLIRGFKMWSKLMAYHDQEGSSSWSKWPSRNDQKINSNCAVHIKINICMTKSRFPDACRIRFRHAYLSRIIDCLLHRTCFLSSIQGIFTKKLAVSQLAHLGNRVLIARAQDR